MTRGVGQRQPPSSGTPSPPPEQRGPQALVEAGKAAALEQVPGKLGGCGPRHSRSLCGGLGAPLRRELGLGGQDLLLGSWEERGQAGWLSLQDKVRAGPGGSGCCRSAVLPLPPKPSPMRPASCSWIFSISMGVVTITWQVPAPQPASISFSSVSCLQGGRGGAAGRRQGSLPPWQLPVGVGVKADGGGGG